MILRIFRPKPKPKPDPLKVAQAECLTAWKRVKNAAERGDTRDLGRAHADLKDATTALLRAEVGR